MRKYKHFLNELRDIDSRIWRTVRTRPVSISAYIAEEARLILKGRI